MAKVSYHLETKGLDDLKKNVKKLHGKSVDWGFLGGTHQGSGLTYASLASILELGIPRKIPSRPAFGELINSLQASNKQLELVLQKPFSDFVTGNVKTPDRILEAAGTHLTSRHKNKMEYWIVGGSKSNDNADDTIALKGFNQPFVETGELVESVDYRKN